MGLRWTGQITHASEPGVDVRTYALPIDREEGELVTVQAEARVGYGKGRSVPWPAEEPEVQFTDGKMLYVWETHTDTLDAESEEGSGFVAEDFHYAMRHLGQNDPAPVMVTWLDGESVPVWGIKHAHDVTINQAFHDSAAGTKRPVKRRGARE